VSAGSPSGCVATSEHLAENSSRWGDRREKLLQGEELQALRSLIFRAPGHPTDGHKGG